MEPPRGIVAFVFTDIEGSSRLWQQLPDATRAALLVHDATLRATCGPYNAYEFGTAGDAFKLAFTSPADAIRWCLAAQKALLEAAWPAEILRHDLAAEVRGDAGELLHRGLRVRMGVHLGPAEDSVHPTTGRTDYHGTTVNAAARVGDAGHGGQIVVTESTWRTATTHEAIDAVARPLGAHALRGVEGAFPMIEVLPPSMAGRSFPPLRTATARKTNVVARRDAFVGRSDERRALEASLAAHRLTTLLGPGGTGKTRLSTEVASEHAARWPGGTWFADLATARSRMDVLVALASALRFPLAVDVSESTAAETAGRAIAALGKALLVLDNFEQVVPYAAATVGAWVDAAPEITLLVTSREPLGIAGEQRLELPPLVPAEAATLFVDRARSVLPNFAPGPADVARIDAICRRLDGLPLAIELAASRVDVMNVNSLAQRLDQRFRLLTAPRTDVSRRQQTLRGAVDWSWDLLEPWEQSALAQCAVFRGGFTVDAADAVIDLSAWPDAPWTLDVLQALRRKSLLRTEPGHAELRLGMYETILAYAAEKLGTGPEREAAEVRHAAFFAEVAETCAAGLRYPGDVECVMRLRAELDNLLAVYDRTIHSADPVPAIRVIASFAPALELFGPAPRYLEMIAAARDAAARLDDPELTVRSLRGWAFALGLAVRPLERDAALARALEIARAHGLREHAADALRERAMGGFYGVVPVDQAEAWMAEAADALKHLGMRPHEGIARTLLSNFVAIGGDLAHAVALWREGLALVRAHCGERDRGWIETGGLAFSALTGEPIESLREVTELAAAPLRRCGDTLNAGSVIGFLGMIEVFLGEIAAGQAHLEEALAMVRPLGAPGRIAQIEISLAAVPYRRAWEALQRGDMAAHDALLEEGERLLRAHAAITGDGTEERDRSASAASGLLYVRIFKARLFGEPPESALGAVAAALGTTKGE